MVICAGVGRCHKLGVPSICSASFLRSWRLCVRKRHFLRKVAKFANERKEENRWNHGIRALPAFAVMWDAIDHGRHFLFAEPGYPNPKAFEE